MTRSTVENIIGASIAVGARIMVTIVILLFLAYVLLVLAVTTTLKRSTQQIKQDYPLTERPPRR